MEDTAAVFRHFSEDDVTRYTDTESCTGEEDARQIILFHIRDSGCRWGLFEKGTGELVGTCGYHCWLKGEASAEIGYDLGKAHWGRGLMQEALRPVISFGFETMNLKRIDADVDPANDRSVRLLRRLAFRLELAPPEGLLRFSLFPADWRKLGERG
jgi:ribosomal-protein-alanine N-acetyltransferase